jgi:hypothetical protein
LFRAEKLFCESAPTTRLIFSIRIENYNNAAQAIDQGQ